MAAAIRELCGGGGETTHRGAVSSPVLQQLALAFLAPNLARLEMQMGLISRNTGSYSGATASFTQPPTCRGASSPLPPRALLCACRSLEVFLLSHDHREALDGPVSPAQVLECLAPLTKTLKRLHLAP